MLETGDDAVLGLRYDDGDCAVVVLNNLSGRRRTVALDLSDEEAATATDLFCDRRYDPLAPGDTSVRLSPYGFRWLRLGGIY